MIQTRGVFKLRLVAFIFCFISIWGLKAQQTVTGTGGNATGNGGSVAYTLGQVFYTHVNGSNTSLAQGVQQPYEISVLTDLKENGVNSEWCAVYPNPVSDFISLIFRESDLSNLGFQLVDVDGRCLEQNMVFSNETKINMNDFAKGTYFIVVSQKMKIVKTFKIIKQ